MGAKVLVIEESEKDRKVLASLFGTRDGKTVLAGLDRTAIHCLKNDGPFGVILLSFSQSPDLALRLLKLITRDFPKIPVLCMGNFLSFDRAAEFKAAGSRAILYKPFTAAGLLEAVARHSEKHPAEFYDHSPRCD